MYLIHVGYIGNRQHDWNTTKGLVYGLRSSSNAFWNAVVAESLSRPDNKGTKSFEDYQLECQGHSSCYAFRIETQKLVLLRFIDDCNIDVTITAHILAFCTCANLLYFAILVLMPLVFSPMMVSGRASSIFAMVFMCTISGPSATGS